MNETLNRSTSVSWVDILALEARRAYQYEKITGLIFDGKFPCAKIDRFEKIIEEDPEFKTG